MLEPTAPRAWAWECGRCGRHARSIYRDRDHTTRTYRAHLRRVHGMRRSEYEMPPEERAIRSEQMKSAWSSGRMTRTITVSNDAPGIQVVVDRGYPEPAHVPMPEGHFAFRLVVPMVAA